jgi:hypothetical protein
MNGSQGCDPFVAGPLRERSGDSYEDRDTEEGTQCRSYDDIWPWVG